jgi:hypothetical protein
MNDPLKLLVDIDYIHAVATNSSFNLVGWVIGIRNPIYGFIMYDTAKITIPCREYI